MVSSPEPSMPGEIAVKERPLDLKPLEPIPADHAMVVLDAKPTTNPYHATMASGGLGGATVIVINWMATLYHVPMPPEVAVSLSVILGAVVGFFIHRSGRAQ